jgi:hypothetical protein
MTFGIQKLAKALGESGCYFFSILRIAELEGRLSHDPLYEAEIAMAEGTMGADCFVRDAGRLLSSATRDQWTCLKAGPGHELPIDYQIKPGEREILRFELFIAPDSPPLAHFVAGNGRSQVEWDPWPESRTVASGRLVSRRIFRKAT